MRRKHDLQLAIEEEVLSICRHLSMKTVDAPETLRKDIGLDCGCVKSHGILSWFR